jgi:hypothetical protein
MSRIPDGMRDARNVARVNFILLASHGLLIFYDDVIMFRYDQTIYPVDRNQYKRLQNLIHITNTNTYASQYIKYI